eukprot:TRINITY_DN26187_c0_g1_i1.p1 TRINITY_DN26187_c0_g1~~TRINITY_DN26187_c0_g1_i1.p1  ORF type:complete len:391 (-),score=74.94 TRINITY_DN26187_c0_g1_i1:22-1194(-)
MMPDLMRLLVLVVSLELEKLGIDAQSPPDPHFVPATQRAICYGRESAKYHFEAISFWRKVRRVADPVVPNCLRAAAGLGLMAMRCSMVCSVTEDFCREIFAGAIIQAQEACKDHVGMQVLKRRLFFYDIYMGHNLNSVAVQQDELLIEPYVPCQIAWQHSAKKFAATAWTIGNLALGVRLFAMDLAVHEDGGSTAQVLLRLLKILEAENPNRKLKAAEIGVFQGRTSRQLLEGMPSLELLLVDPYMHMTTDFVCNAAKTVLDPSGVRADMLSETDAYADRRILRRQTSLAAADDVQDASLDLVFIDGNHTYLGAKEDIAAWRSKVRPGGFISGHDWNHRHDGVTRAVPESFPPEELWLAPDSVWIYQVPQPGVSEELLQPSDFPTYTPSS